MTNEVDVQKYVEAFLDSLRPVEDQLFQAYLLCVMEVQKDGNPLPLHILGSGLAMIAYKTAMAFQHNLRLDDNKPIPHGHIIGSFVEGINNACVLDHAMIGISLKPEHIELFCALLKTSDAPAAPLLLEMLQQHLATYKPLIEVREEELNAQRTESEGTGDRDG